ncbi:MAG TPA: EF-hand domain-containing protein [Thiobacillus sp.]|nr:EF-hand domain-containing protein [Thiobacillus sp.]
MKPGISKIHTRLAALLLGVAILPAYAAGDRKAMSFKDFDTNKDGYLSLDEFKAKGKDELAFKAADINGDGQLDPDEFEKYLAKKAGDQPKADPGTTMQPKPAQPSSGY